MSKFVYDNSCYLDSIPKEVENIIREMLDLSPDYHINTYDTFESLGADSLDFVEMLMKVEHVYLIAIPDSKAEKVRTIGDFVKLVNECKDDANCTSNFTKYYHNNKIW